MSDTDKEISSSATPEKKSVVFETIKGACIGIGATLAASAIVGLLKGKNLNSAKNQLSKNLVEDITTGSFFGGGVGLIMGNRHNDKIDMKNLIQSNKQENPAAAAPSTPSR